MEVLHAVRPAVITHVFCTLRFRTTGDECRNGLQRSIRPVRFVPPSPCESAVSQWRATSDLPMHALASTHPLLVRDVRIARSGRDLIDPPGCPARDGGGSNTLTSQNSRDGYSLPLAFITQPRAEELDEMTAAWWDPRQSMRRQPLLQVVGHGLNRIPSTMEHDLR